MLASLPLRVKPGLIGGAVIVNRGSDLTDDKAGAWFGGGEAHSWEAGCPGWGQPAGPDIQGSNSGLYCRFSFLRALGDPQIEKTRPMGGRMRPGVQSRLFLFSLRPRRGHDGDTRFTSPLILGYHKTFMERSSEHYTLQRA